MCINGRRCLTVPSGTSTPWYGAISPAAATDEVRCRRFPALNGSGTSAGSSRPSTRCACGCRAGWRLSVHRRARWPAAGASGQPFVRRRLRDRGAHARWDRLRVGVCRRPLAAGPRHQRVVWRRQDRHRTSPWRRRESRRVILVDTRRVTLVDTRCILRGRDRVVTFDRDSLDRPRTSSDHRTETTRGIHARRSTSRRVEARDESRPEA